MDRTQTRILAVVLAVLLTAVVAVYVFTALMAPEAPPFTPPPREPLATEGFAAPPDEEGQYRTVTVSEGFAVGICTVPAVRDGALRLFFSCDAQNTVWLRLVVMTDEGEVLGESGILTPGQCLTALPLSATKKRNTTRRKELQSRCSAPRCIAVAEDRFIQV